MALVFCSIAQNLCSIPLLLTALFSKLRTRYLFKVMGLLFESFKARLR